MRQMPAGDVVTAAASDLIPDGSVGRRLVRAWRDVSAVLVAVVSVETPDAGETGEALPAHVNRDRNAIAPDLSSVDG